MRAGLSSKHKTFVSHLYNVGPKSQTLVQSCKNGIQMFCVYWVAILFSIHTITSTNSYFIYVLLFCIGPPGKTRFTKVRDTASYKFTRRELPDCIARRFLCAQRDYPIRLSSPGQRLSTKNTAVIRVSDSAR